MNTGKRTYTIILSLVFIAIGAYKLYERFILLEEIPSYQWMLSIVLIGLGIYQLVGINKKPKA